MLKREIGNTKKLMRKKNQKFFSKRKNVGPNKQFNKQTKAQRKTKQIT